MRCTGVGFDCFYLSTKCGGNYSCNELMVTAERFRVGGLKVTLAVSFGTWRAFSSLSGSAFSELRA